MTSAIPAWANFVAFYVGWAACVGGAGRGQLWLGPGVAVVLLALHLRAAADRGAEIRLLVAVAVLGFAADTALASFGLFAFAGTSPAPWLSPPWMVSLWLLFGATLNGSMAWLSERYLLGALLGAVFGPGSYVAGAALGAIALRDDSLATLAAIALAWALLLPAVLVVRRWAAPRIVID